MAATRALACYDIALEVLEHLAPAQSAPHSSSTTLASVARVNRSLSDPALDVLWRNLENITHLFRVLPSLRPDSPKSPYYVLSRDITANEWRRFVYYSIRVRNLHAVGTYYLCASVWAALARWSGERPLLPHLQSLNIRINSDHLAQFFNHLISPSVQSVTINIDDLCSTRPVTLALFESILQEMGPLLLQVSKLAISNPRPNRRFLERPPALYVEAARFWELAHLRELSVTIETVITHHRLSALSAFPNLLHLDLRIDSMPDISAEKLASGFHELRSLHLSATLGDTARFVASIDSYVLERVSFRFESRRDEGADLDNIHSIFARLPSSSIHTLHVDFGRTAPVRAHPLDRVIEPIRRLAQLRALAVHAHTEIQGVDLASAIRAWPLLTSFHFHTSLSARGGDCARPSKPLALDTLAAFAAAHPLLTDLRLPSVSITPEMSATHHNPTSVPGEACTGAIPALDHGLRILQVPRWEFLDVAGASVDGAKERRARMYDLALLLDRLFPRLSVRGKARRWAETDCSESDEQAVLAMMLDLLQAGRVRG